MYGEKEKPMTREGISEGFKKTPKDSDSSNPKGRPSVQDLKRVSESFQEIDPVDKDLELFSEGSKKFKTESEKNNRKRQSPRKTSAGPSGSLVGINKVNESENNPARFEECKESSDSGNREGQPQPKTAAGPSGSLWGLNQLNDLSCIPLFGMDMGIILPRGFDCAKVMNDIDKCYIVKRILNEVTVPSRNDLAQFNKTHMSWYLFNPWCLFFTALRDNLARRNPVIAEKQLNKDATQESESRIEDEDKDEPTSEGLLHRFMEVILLLFSILRGERDDWRSTPRRTVVTTVVGKSKCTIEDDGYVYLTRGGTTGHEESEETATDVNPPNRSRHGGEPVIRFEACLLDPLDICVSQALCS
ncbi:hypothetical protein BO99DRAFT_163429 [Aspergillus violaceofuscus CBS 115571]|uniref:Uncharacterized protein n=1 Tax=Aspergillus violaceofuscus (strain CBS 115571) TaxID=1450538 RepID=A0A2V5H3T2_ASPV1|nr:hypothetical protein BO99DRAFT_163429 [Aspergillus violaceofuscus CBS 115571]